MSRLTVLISAEGRGKWCLKVEPGACASARDTLAMLERTGALNYADADLIERLINVIENSR